MWVHRAAASISPVWQPCCPAAQIEARARQMEGRDLGQQAAVPGGKPPPGKYERGRQGAAPGLLSTPKAYNPDADATATAGKEEKKKVSCSLRRPEASGICRDCAVHPKRDI